MQRVHVGRTLLVGFLCWLVALPTTFIQSVEDLPSPWPILLPPAAGLVVALLLAFVQAAIPTSAPAPQNRSRGRSPGVGLLIAVVTIVAVIGIGGLVGSWATRAAAQLAGFDVGPVPGLPNNFEREAVERLEKQRTGKAGKLALTVTSVRQGARTVRAEVTVTNRGDDSVTLPLYGYCTLATEDGTTLAANSFKSQWATTVPGDGQALSGVIVFDGVFPPDKTKARLSFTTVFGPDGGSLAAKGIRLRAMPP